MTNIKNQKIKSTVINIDSEILSGTPVFKGTRVPIKNLFDYLETGERVEKFLKDFPSVTHEQVTTLLRDAEEFLTNSA